MFVTFHNFRLAAGSLFACIVIGVAAVTALTVRSRTITKNATTTTFSTAAYSSNAPAASAAPLQVQSSVARLEMERVTITPTGFEPNQITRGPGRFLLAVDNRSGLDDLALRLDGQIARLLTQRVSRRKASWREVLDLVPGDYALSEANHCSTATAM